MSSTQTKAFPVYPAGVPEKAVADNRRNWYWLLLVVLLLALAAIFYRYTAIKQEKQSKTYMLQPRKGNTSLQEWKEIEKRAQILQASLQQEPNDVNANLAMAAIFINEARITGNHMYYDAAALQHVNKVLESDSANFNALVYKALLYLSQHHFTEALQTANKARAVNPYNAYVYGLMVDANVELGLYDSAIVNADRMVAKRPDLTSYSRVSYVREIMGDVEGAIEAMRMAVVAGGPGDEPTEWARVQLARLYEKTGNVGKADTLYQSSLNLRPGYAHAIAGLGRVAMARGDYRKAVALFEQADTLTADNSVKEDLLEAYRMAGDGKKATAIQQQMVEQMAAIAAAGEQDEETGHYSDRELAHAYLQANDHEKALRHAIAEYNRRPGNIDVNETVAWVLYNKGEYAKALPYIKKALSTGSKNPELLYKAALVHAANGDTALAQQVLQNTNTANPFVNARLRTMVAKLNQ